MSEIVNFLVNTIGSLGYFGIFTLMFLESSFFPFPSEVVMIPAGYLAFQGEMELVLVLLSGLLGSLAGAWFNYLLALKFGRKFLSTIISHEKIDKLDKFFEKHGHISTFSGRLIPGIRQYISFPAGLARMNGIKFSIYTTLGAGIWITILTMLGYFLGENEKLISIYLKDITIFIILLVVLTLVWYFKRNKQLVN
ncbi:MAG TPA: DedA family protein [Sulfurospirillum sp. UBA12182]|jgi:membrane protein DedA with SNARE-associated domain|nr:MAG TPA: DedA family protein [Sulfurospirillum sp. UBA12182]